MEKKHNNIWIKVYLIFIGIGIWLLVLQNIGVLPTDHKVYIVGGQIDSKVSGSVDVYGSVSVDNTVDVNIHAINGHNTVTTGVGTHSVFPFGYMLPVDSW